jgi:hypothetical protein
MTRDSHPDALALDAHRAGEPAPGVAKHLEECEVCSAELALQHALAAELGAPIAIEVPRSQDDALRVAARQRAQVIRSRRRWPLIAGAGLVAAAAAIVLLMLARGPGATTNPVATAQLRGDINLDGQLDVIDALVLARQLDGGGADVTRADLNRDGTVDHADVEWISSAIVSVRRTP